MKIIGVILAAGKSSRMKSGNKLLLKYGNHTIIEEVVQRLLASQVDELIIVTGFEHEQIKKLFNKKRSDRISIVYNKNFQKGRAESIKCAIKEIHNNTDAALFMVGDKPEISTNLINRALDKFRKEKPDILYVNTPNGRGHPIIFSKTLFDDLLNLQGDLIGEELIAKYKGNIVILEDDVSQIDINNDKDYDCLIQKIKDNNQ